MSDRPLLTVKDLTVGFEGSQGFTQAIHQISFEVFRGRTTAIVGESGSGKSVTAQSIMRLLPTGSTRYLSGNIYFRQGERDSDLSRISEQEMRDIRGNRIAMIFQEPMTALNPLMRCGHQVMEALMRHKGLEKREAKEKTISLLTEVQLPDPKNIFQRYPHQISGGQKQRVMIAMAMSCEPDLLIADEPTTALDVTVQKSILELIRALQQKNQMGVIFITHDLGLVADIADQVVVMYRGRIVEQGNAEDVLGRPEHPYTKALLACRPILHPPGERLPQVEDFLAGQPSTANRTEPVQQKITIPETDDSGTTLLKEAQPLFMVTDLQVRFPTQKTLLGRPKAFHYAVNGVSFEIQEGETLGLVGESGCGKTTLGRCLLQLTPATSGEINFKGRDITRLAAKNWQTLRKEIQIIFQDPYSSLNPRISIGNAITETMNVHGIAQHDKERKALTIDLLEKVGLKADHYRRYPHEFSGGQRQRIGIARALALHPTFLVCDESVSALDVSVQAQVLNLLNDLKKTFGFTILFISHDLGVVHYISDRIMVMQEGKIVEEGPSEAIFYHPKHPYTCQLMEAIPGHKVFLKK